ncbi:MAG: HAMP domain-containing sensor histidine kinase [Nakamurella sp.]
MSTNDWSPAQYDTQPIQVVGSGAPPPAPMAANPAGPRQEQYPVSHRRWSLRARLIALVVATAALALVAVDIALPLVVRDAAINEKDATLANALAAVNRSRVTADDLRQLSTTTTLGEIGWSTVTISGISQVLVRPVSDQSANPDFTQDMDWLGAAATVPDSSDPEARYRAQGVRATAEDDGTVSSLVAWIPLDDVDKTVQRVIIVELLITAGLLLLLGVTAGFVIRRELKPLESMATAADEIALGDLTRRVDESDPSTEIGRLGVAFNDMLDGISTLLDERRRSETRLRQFVADASHELRTPVAAVRGYTDLYQAGALPDQAAVERAMSRMGFEAKRMGALVDDLLTLIQADAERTLVHDSVDLSELLTGVVDDAAVIDPTRTWRLAVGYGPAIAAGDRLRLHQLFANLLANVRTHTPPGTVATVSVLPGLDEIAVSVSDNGPGVSEEAIHRLFDRFFRVDASRSRENGGTGLGLSIVAAIVRSHGGQILASHTPGGGLTMTVVLPRATGTAAVPTRGGSSSGQTGGSVPGPASTLGGPVNPGMTTAATAGQGAPTANIAPDGKSQNDVPARSASPGDLPAT